jgi:NAD(P)-dependent dehydrogenase (short-subunit alcohol dehydrogenase family)
MKIIVIGGGRLIGTRLVSKLRQRGYEVVAASPSLGVNTMTGEGLVDALAGGHGSVARARRSYGETASRRSGVPAVAPRREHHRFDLP